MNNLKTTLLGTMVLGVAACGGSGDGSGSSRNLQFDAQTAAGQSSGVDLVLSDVSFVNGPRSEAGKTVAIEARLVNIGSSAYDMSDVSMALEYSTTESFDRVYKTVVFDIRTTEDGSNSTGFTARTSPAGLPSGSYFTRLAVNPDWRMHFNNLPAESDYSRTSRYLAESDYSNNVSDTYLFNVSSQVSCVEDSLESDNDFGSATYLQSNGTVNASLCEDDVDLFAMPVQGGQSVAVTLNYDSSDNYGTTRYLVLDPQHKRVGDGGIAKSGESIRIDAASSGDYYLALYGDRSEYSLSYLTDASLFNDAPRPFFTAQSMQGPYSSVYGQITLKKLAFDQEMLNGEIATCGVRVASYHNGQAVGYVTPQHFSETHVFRFVDGGSYFVDGSVRSGWTTEYGDVSNADWYTNLYPGWAEDIGNRSWRYWERDGLSYVECSLEG